MTNHQKVIEGLEYCTTHYNCRNLRGQSCPYISNCKPLEDATGNTIIRDALDLIKEQQKLIDEITQRRTNNGAFD